MLRGSSDGTTGPISFLGKGKWVLFITGRGPNLTGVRLSSFF